MKIVEISDKVIQVNIPTVHEQVLGTAGDKITPVNKPLSRLCDTSLIACLLLTFLKTKSELVSQMVSELTLLANTPHQLSTNKV
jgi:hypothetical protein